MKATSIPPRLSTLVLVLFFHNMSEAQTLKEFGTNWLNRSKQKAIETGKKYKNDVMRNPVSAFRSATGSHANSKIRKSDFRQNKNNPAFNPDNTRFGISKNLYVDIKGKYPPGYQPSWRYIGKTAALNFTVDNYIANPLSPTESRNIAIGDYRGKASLVFNSFITCDCIADIVIADSFCVLTEKPQTFKVTNFRKFCNNTTNGEKCVGQMNNIYTAGGFEGEITLSANSDGDITMGVMIENYRLADQFSSAGVSYRYTADDVTMENMMSAEKANAIVEKEVADKQRQAEYLAKSKVQLTALYKVIAKKYPGYNCRSCISRELQGHVRGTPYYYERSGEYAKTEYDLTGEITIENRCNQKLTIIGIKQMHDDVKGYYFVDVAKTMDANYHYNIEHTLFSYIATSLLGMNEDFTIQDEYNLSAASVGSIQWVKVIGTRKP